MHLRNGQRQVEHEVGVIRTIDEFIHAPFPGFEHRRDLTGLPVIGMVDGLDQRIFQQRQVSTDIVRKLEITGRSVDSAAIDTGGNDLIRKFIFQPGSNIADQAVI